jgi:hypothetical protein
MASAIEWSNAELTRAYGLTYQGRILRVCLAISTTGLNKNSTTSQWDAVEITSQSADGYSRYQITLPAGSYNSQLLRYETPQIVAGFQALPAGLGLQYSTVYFVLGTQSGNSVTWDTNIAGLFTENPTIALQPGEPRTYRIKLLCDDIASLS